MTAIAWTAVGFVIFGLVAVGWEIYRSETRWYAKRRLCDQRALRPSFAQALFGGLVLLIGVAIIAIGLGVVCGLWLVRYGSLRRGDGRIFGG